MSVLHVSPGRDREMVAFLLFKYKKPALLDGLVMVVQTFLGVEERTVMIGRAMM